MKPFIYILFVLLSFAEGLWGQNKTTLPSTYEPLCFFTIKQANFSAFTEIAEALEKKDYFPVFQRIKQMRNQLKKFKPEQVDRGFELWYIGNYSDFNEQANVAKVSTLNLLKNYENRLRLDQALYYEHRHFLELYLAYATEAFYPEYWFMSQERYFSKKAVQRLIDNNQDGDKLFQYSSFYAQFEPLNALSENEHQATADYLDLDKKTAQKSNFIPYSYWSINPKNAQFLLNNFKWNDSSLDIDVNREIRAIVQFLEAAQKQEIFLVARFNMLQLPALKRK